MPRMLICTVGLSLISSSVDKKSPWIWHVTGKEPLPDLEVVLRWLRDANPKVASAETNTLSSYGFDEYDRLVLLPTDTPASRLCAEVLAAHYRDCSRGVTVQVLPQLGYDEKRFAYGLRLLVDAVLGHVRAARESGQVPVFAASGGFKAETAFLSLLGALLEIEVVYVHELHKGLVTLPRLPFAWDADFVARHEDFFAWIDAEPRPSIEVESWLRGRPELRPLVEDDDEGNSMLTAAGDLLFKAARESLKSGPRATWPEADPRPPQHKNHVSTVAHHRPAGWEGFVSRLCAVDCVTSVRYDAAAHGGPRAKILDPSSGAIGIRYGSGTDDLPLRVETTARGEAQCDLVASYLRNLK